MGFKLCEILNKKWFKLKKHVSKFIFFRGYLESFSSVLKTPRTSVNNITSSTENEKPEIDNSISTNLNVIKEYNCKTKELCTEIKNEVKYWINLNNT